MSEQVEQRRLAGLSYVITEYHDLLGTGRFSPGAATLLAGRMHRLAAHWADLRGLSWGEPQDHDRAVADAQSYRDENPDAISDFVVDFEERHRKGGPQGQL